MPKVNVYLPSDLAAAVRAAGFPISPICQKALAEAVRSAAGARAVIEALRDPGLDASGSADLLRQAEEQMTRRLVHIVETTLAGREPGEPAGTGDLLLGLLDEDANLCIRILQAFDVEPDELRATVERVRASQPAEPQPGAAGQASSGEASLSLRLTMPARDALAAAIEAAIGLGHNYVGTEHLLLGLLADGQSVGGRALHEHKVQAADARRALTAALAGFTFGQQAPGPGPQDTHDEISRRLDAVESRLAALGG